MCRTFSMVSSKKSVYPVPMPVECDPMDELVQCNIVNANCPDESDEMNPSGRQIHLIKIKLVCNTVIVSPYKVEGI